MAQRGKAEQIRPKEESEERWMRRTIGTWRSRQTGGMREGGEGSEGEKWSFFTLSGAERELELG